MREMGSEIMIERNNSFDCFDYFAKVALYIQFLRE